MSRPDLLICDEVTSALDVLAHAAIVEFGSVGHILTDPEQEYTKRLLANTPVVPTG